MGVYLLVGVLIGILSSIIIKKCHSKIARKRVVQSRDIISAISEPIIIINSQYRILESYNTDSCGACDLLSVGSDLRDMFARENLELMVSTIESAAVGQKCEIELSVERGGCLCELQINLFRSTSDRTICIFRNVDKFWTSKKQYVRNKAILGHILDAFPFPVMIKDATDDFKYIYWNKQCDLISGFNRRDVLGKTDIDIYGAERGAKLREADLKVQESGEHYSKQEAFITDDGVYHDTIVSKDLICGESNKWILVTRWEITDQVTAQKSLALANKQLNMIFSAGNITPWMWDLQSNALTRGGTDFELQTTSPIRPNVVAPLEYVIANAHPDDRAKMGAIVHQFINKEIDRANILMRYDIDGLYEKFFNVFAIVESTDESGAPIKIIGSMQDVTEQKNYEKQIVIANQTIEQVNQTNQVILDNTDIGLVYLTPDYVVQWENASKYNNNPLAQHYRTGDRCYENKDNMTGPCPSCIMKTALAEGRTASKEIIFGDTITQIDATPVYEADGECSGVVLKIKDITADKRRELDLRAAKESAEKSDKLKSAFLANMSHEIRTPLNSILGFSELLSMTDDSQEKEDYLKIIKTNNELLLQLINDILDLSKIEANTLEFVYTDVELDDLLIDLERSFIFKEAANSRVEIIFERPQISRTILTDRNRLQQVVSNFITNALKFTDSGSVKFGYEVRGSDTYFYVTDTGTGIPQDKQSEIFKRFTKLDTFKTGTGLGLTICQTIVQKLNGQIGVESELGRGSTFWFIIPEREQPKKESAKQPKAAVPARKITGQPQDSGAQQSSTSTAMTIVEGKPVLLIAEDVIDNYKLYSVILGKRYHLLHAWNGVEAVAMYKEHNPTAILMDIKMPLMDGYQATAAIREIDTQIPIIAVTAFAFAEDRKTILSSGFTDFVAKPIHSKTLNEVLNRINL